MIIDWKAQIRDVKQKKLIHHRETIEINKIKIKWLYQIETAVSSTNPNATQEEEAGLHSWALREAVWHLEQQNSRLEEQIKRENWKE
jgi:hypothetical protein